MNYEDLTKRIEKAKEERNYGRSVNDFGWWNGYIAALNDVRNDINTGDKK